MGARLGGGANSVVPGAMVNSVASTGRWAGWIGRPLCGSTIKYRPLGSSLVCMRNEALCGEAGRHACRGDLCAGWLATLAVRDRVLSRRSCSAAGLSCRRTQL